MPVVNTQPTVDGNGDTQYEQHVKWLNELDVEDVELWSVKDVCEQFVERLDLKHLCYNFIDHMITGHVLLTLTKQDLAMMDIPAVGERVYIDQCLVLLRKATRKSAREVAIWEGSYPVDGPGKQCAYYMDTTELDTTQGDVKVAVPDDWVPPCSKGECLKHIFCPCLMGQVTNRITSQGLRIRKKPPSCNIRCEGRSTDFEDFRFMKDIDSTSLPTYCRCFGMRRTFIFTFDTEFTDKSNIKLRGDGLRKIYIAHPTLTEGDDYKDESKKHASILSKIRSTWAEARLVAAD